MKTLPEIVKRLGDLQRLENEWRKKHDQLLRDIGQDMRDHREAAKVSLRELARRIGCSAAFLSDMELGRRRYSIEWCRKTFSSLANAEARHAAKDSD